MKNNRVEQEYKGKGRITTVEEFYKRELSIQEFLTLTWQECGWNENYLNKNTSLLADFFDGGAKHIQDIMIGRCSLQASLIHLDELIKKICDIQITLSNNSL